MNTKQLQSTMSSPKQLANSKRFSSTLQLHIMQFKSLFMSLLSTKPSLLLAIVFLLSSFVAQAQNITVSYNSTAQPDAAFTVCGVAQTNSLKISNGNGTAMTGILATLHIPTGGVYVAGSITGATESNISNLNTPVFSVPTIPASNNTNITYQIMYGCGVIAYQNGGGLTKETVDFAYNAGATQTGVTTPSTYNVIAAALSITNLTNTSYAGNVGSSFTQTATIVNGGLGCTSSAYIKLNNASGSFSFSNPSIGTISNDTLFLSAALMPGGDGLWCNGESLTVSFTTTLLNCNNLNRSTYAGWGCGGAGCQTSTPINSNIIVSNSTPILTFSVPTPDYNYCYTGDTKKQIIRIVNSGSGPATNVSIYLRATNGKTYFDTTVAWNVKDKNGNIIGQMKNFTGVTLTSLYNSSCVSYNAMYQGTGSLVNIIVPANDTIYLEIQTVTQNFNCVNNYCGSIMYWSEIYGAMSYKNQCGSGNYADATPSTAKYLYGRAYEYFVSTITTPTDISGTAPNNNFDITLDYSVLTTISHPNNKGTTYLILPGLSALEMQPTATSVSITNSTGGIALTLPLKTISDTMWIGPFPQNYSNGSLQMKIPMQAICGVGGLKTLNFAYMVKYDTTCSNVKYIKMACSSSTLTMHCPAPCPKGGATPLLFTLTRANYGLVDNNNDGVPDASGSLDLSKIATHSVVSGDTVKGIWNIKINPNNDPTDAHFGQIFQYTYIDFDLGAVTYPGYMSSINSYLTALPNAQVTIYPAGGGAAINCTVTPTITGTKAHYDFNSCHSPWANGDSMVVKALYTVNAAIYANYSRSGDVIKFTTQNQVYSTYLPQTTPTTAPTANTTYTCDSYNDYLNVLNLRVIAALNNGYNIPLNGCTSSILVTLRQWLRGQNDYNLFPYEYRNFYIPKKVTIILPHGFVYRANSTTTSLYGAIADANITQVGDSLFIDNLNTYTTTYGGVKIPKDERTDLDITFSVNPTCDAIAGNLSGNVKADGIGNVVNTPSIYYSYQNSGFGELVINEAAKWQSSIVTNNPNQYTYTPPQPVLAGGGTQTSNTGTATWILQLQNLSNSVAASNSYFYISPKNLFTNIVVKEGATVIAPDANGFYQLGNLAASANRNFTVTADLGKCGLDSMQLNYGWGCSGYPTTFTLLPCQTTSVLKASGFPAALDVTFDRIPASGTVGLCTPFTLEAVINSNLVGNLDNEVYRVILPPSVSYVTGSVQALYPVGGSYTASAYNPTINPAATGDTLVFAVNSLTGGVGLTGVGDLTKNQVKIKFNAQTTCGYISGSSAKAIVTGVSVCGDPTAIVVKTSSGVSLTGANPTTQYQITETGANSVSTCGSAQTYTFTVKNTGTTTPPANDSLTINLSNGLSYVAGSIVGIHNAPSPTAPVINGNLLRWRIPGTVAPGDSMKFTINLTANSAGCGQNTMDIYATQSIALSCGGNPCSTPVIVGRLISDTITTICCVDMQVTKTVSPSPVAAGATAVYTIAVKNNGPGTATNIVVNDVLPAGVTYVSNTTTSGTYTAPDWTIPTMASGQRDTIRFTVTANNATTSPVTVSNTAYVKSINNTTPETNRTNDTSRVNLTINPNCTGVAAGIDQTACGNTSATITGVPTTGVWTALGTNPTGANLGSTTAGVATVSFTAAANGNYDFILTDGACKDTTRIVVTAKPNAGTDKSVVCYVTDAATMTATGTGTWTAMAGNPGTSVITTPSSATTTITNFSVAGTYNFIWSNNGCTDTVAVVVGNACTCPIANNSITTTNSTQCTPFAGITIDGTTATPLTNTSYQWIVNAGSGWANATGASTTEDYTTGALTAGTYQYRRIFIHTGVPVCRDTTAAITITVNAKPNAGADITGVCGGSSIVLPNVYIGSYAYGYPLASNPLGANFYAIAGFGNYHIDFDNNANGSYGFVQIFHGCTDTMFVTVNAKPNASLDHTIECGSTQATDTLKGLPVGGVWSALSTNPTGVTLGTTTNNGVAAIGLPSAPTQGTWSFVYTANGCTDTMNVTIGITGNPMPSVNMGSNPICKNGTVQLCPTVWGWSNYQWYKNGIAIATSAGTASCITLSPADTGIYTLKATNGSGCWTSLSTPINVKYDSTCNASVTGGGSGGVESKTLGDVIAVRLYGNAINSRTEVDGITNGVRFNNSGVITNGTQDLSLSALIPATVANTDAAYVSTPTDLVNFTNAVEVLAIDYTKGSSTKAVAFGTKTLGDVYSHTKPICDRLKGAQLMEVKTLNVKGYNVIAYKVQQCSGEVEYAMNLSAGKASNRGSISLQSNWFTDSYVADEQLYNFQLWAVSYDMVQSIAAEIIGKLQANGSVNAVTATDLPKAYVTAGNRKAGTVSLTINNNTTATTGYVALREKANETAQEVVKQVPVNITANNASTVSIDVKDSYEATISLYINNQKTDMLYLNDGTWSSDYNKATTTMNSFVVSNEGTVSNNTNEYRLLRNVNFSASTKDYVTLYKTIGTKCNALSLSNYNSLKFNSAAMGANSVTITLISSNISNWNDQYSYTVNLNGSEEYAIGLNNFKSSKYPQSVNSNTITGVSFAFNSSRGIQSNMSASLSQARFSTSNVLATESNITLGVYPNPNVGTFTAKFTSEASQNLVLKVTEVATGRVVKTMFVQATKGTNQQVVTLNNNTATGNYIVTLDGDAVKYKAAKLVLGK